MTNRLDLYECKICGNIVQIMHSGFGELNCCNEPMKLMPLNINKEEKGEFHIPVIINENEKEFIQVGKEFHPMTEEHHIEFIQVISGCGKKILLHFLDTNDEPKIEMNCSDFGNYKMKELCNIHGLWENKKNN